MLNVAAFKRNGATVQLDTTGAEAALVYIDGSVLIHQEHSRLIASVEDDGTGFDPSNRPREAFPRFGLAIMRERAESIGGSLEIDTSPGTGTRVKIRVPTATRVI